MPQKLGNLQRISNLPKDANEINTVFVFDEPIPRGKYFVAICSRCGRGTDYKVVRCRREVTAL